MPQLTPASRVFPFTITVPAGTTAAAPQSTDTTLPVGQVVRIEIDVPDGHARYTGIILTVADGPYIPYGYRNWLIANGHTFEWDFAGLPDSGSWSVLAYNTDIFPHSFYVRYFILDDYLIDQSVAVAAPTPTPVLV